MASFMLFEINNYMTAQKALLLKLVLRSCCNDSYFNNEKAVKKKKALDVKEIFCPRAKDYMQNICLDIKIDM